MDTTLTAAKTVELQHPAGYTADIALQGATVVSWKVNGQEKLFTSSKSSLDGPAAVRGGLPVVFPVFGPPPQEPPFEKLKQHGFARISKWSLESPSKTNADGSVSLVLSLVPNEEIKKVFEPDFALSYTVTLHKTGALETSLKVINPSPTAVLRFQTLLHTYLRLPEGLQPIDVAVRGLEGLSYADKVGGGVQTQGADEPIKFEDEVDRVYFDAPNSASLVDLKNGRKFLDVQKNNFDTYTVWNPHKAKSDALGDMEADGWTRFVCVEPGHAKSFVELAPGQENVDTQILVPGSD